MNRTTQFVAKLNEYVQSRPELLNEDQEQPSAKQRILVALDASPESLAALEAAVSLARLLGAEVCGIFVEDSDLERLCSLPFSAEVGAYSATARTLSHFCITREFHALEEGLRLTLQRAAATSGVSWSLRVARGGVTSELLNAASDAAMISLGRIGWSRRNQLGSTAATVIRHSQKPLLLPGKAASVNKATANRANSDGRDPQAVASFDEIKLVYTGTDAADRALGLAHGLALSSGRQLVVYYIADPLTESAVRNRALAQAAVISLRQRGTSHILQTLQRSQPGLTVLADADAHTTHALMERSIDPVLLIS